MTGRAGSASEGTARPASIVQVTMTDDDAPPKPVRPAPADGEERSWSTGPSPRCDRLRRVRGSEATRAGDEGDRGDKVDRSDIAAIAGGDQRALERLYERHRGPLVAFVGHITGDRGLAEEVLQDTLLAIWHHAGRFEPRARVRTWMYTIARRNALSRLRRRRPAVTDVGDLDPVATGAPGPDEVALAAIGSAELWQLIEKLPDTHQVVMLLGYVEDLSYPEIATVLDISVGTVKSRVSRSRAMLADLARSEGLMP